MPAGGGPLIDKYKSRMFQNYNIGLKGLKPILEDPDAKTQDSGDIKSKSTNYILRNKMQVINKNKHAQPSTREMLKRMRKYEKEKERLENEEDSVSEEQMMTKPLEKSDLQAWSMNYNCASSERKISLWRDPENMRIDKTFLTKTNINLSLNVGDDAPLKFGTHPQESLTSPKSQSGGFGMGDSERLITGSSGKDGHQSIRGQ